MLPDNFAFGLLVEVSATMAATPTKLHVKRKFCSALTKFAAEFVMAAFGQPSIEMLDTLLKLKLRITDWLCKCSELQMLLLLCLAETRCIYVPCGTLFDEGARMSRAAWCSECVAKMAIDVYERGKSMVFLKIASCARLQRRLSLWFFMFSL